jgi:lipopolysaccharide transport system ATP-binding protein
MLQNTWSPTLPSASGGSPKASLLDYAVDIVNLSKSFRRATLSKGGYTTIKSTLLNLFRGTSTPAHYTHVIKDLTMRIPRGASVGLIGRNGSGKSTFLKLITGIYKPDKGTIQVRGRLAALIELGAGFHPDFTGRENLYLGGVMHGLTRAQVEERFDEIVNFAELAEVIDDPVRTYSSGMFMRLGFSLAVHTDPDILLVDEVLAVGDAAFVAKCKDKIAALRKAGKTLVLVTHDLDAVERWCDEALWLNDGEVRDRGEPRRVIDRYHQFLEKGEEAELQAAATSAKEAKTAAESAPASESSELERQRWGSREIEITGVRLSGSDAAAKLVFHPEDPFTIAIDYHVHQKVDDLVFGVSLNRADGLIAHGSNSDIAKQTVPSLTGSGTVRYHLKRLGLSDGSYTLDVAVHRKDGYPYDYHKGVCKFAVRCPQQHVGVYIPEYRWEF